MEILFGAFNVVSPLLLIGFIIFFTMRQRKRRPREDAASEEGARRLRQQLDAERQEREDKNRLADDAPFQFADEPMSDTI